MKDITVAKVSPDDMVVLIPHNIVGDGEPGDPLAPNVIHIIHIMVKMGYGVLDFGEDHGTHYELFFVPTKFAEAMSRNFIQRGGDV